jgi:hypothetical protein
MKNKITASEQRRVMGVVALQKETEYKLAK